MEENQELLERKDFRVIPKRKLSEAEKQIISLRIEKMKIEREKSLLILGGSIILFFAFLIVSIVGLLNDLITRNQLNIMVLVGLVALIIGIIPYLKFVMKEEKSLEKFLDELTS
ncbi:hypothetical protein J4212_00245 [Candidatus Woesearchaeota archaeon]|nr:hypothetical protein [Candidatus Woesearchaeota archaeon]